MTVHIKDISALVEGYVEQACKRIDQPGQTDTGILARVLSECIAHLEVVCIIGVPLTDELCKGMVEIFLQGIIEERKKFAIHRAKAQADEAMQKAAQ